MSIITDDCRLTFVVSYRGGNGGGRHVTVKERVMQFLIVLFAVIARVGNKIPFFISFFSRNAQNFDDSFYVFC